MKKIFYLLIFALLSLSYACNDDDHGEEDYKVYAVGIQLIYPENSVISAVEGIQVTLYDTSEKSYNANTDTDGKVSFKVPAGVYRAVASDSRAIEGKGYKLNGAINEIAITKAWDENKVIDMQMDGDTEGKLQVIIKELYVGGCQKPNDAGVFHMDKYVILYNNSDLQANLDNLCLGMVYPMNAFAANNDMVGGKLVYDGQGWIPAGHGVWYFPTTLTIEPYSDVVIALNGGIDNTTTYSNSVNLDNANYYYTYDVKEYENTLYYPAPNAIPSDHHFKAVKYGKGSGWNISTSSPAFYIFTTKDIDPVAFANDEERNHYHGGKETVVNKEKKVPIEWVLDGVEVFSTSRDKNQKRLTSTIDVGQTYLTHRYGYTSYRNVDKEATEAIEGNKNLLVYNYDKGTADIEKGTTDPSGIDAEASLKKGAKIVYKDTNNSTNDFHQRKQASLKD